jgi:WD40 repeat protein
LRRGGECACPQSDGSSSTSIVGERMMRRICELLLAALMIAAMLMATASVGFSQEPLEKSDTRLGLPRLVSTMNGQARDSGKLKVVKKNSSLQIVETATGNPVGPPLVHEDEWQIECWRFSPDDKWLAVGLGFVDPGTGWNHGCVYLWDVATGNLVKEFQKDDDNHGFGRVSDVAFAKSGDLFNFSPTTQSPPRLVAGGNVGKGSRESDKYKIVGLQVADKATGERLSPELVHRDENDRRDWTIECWAFTPDNKWVASGSGYVNGKLPESLGKIDLWEIGTWKHVATIHGFGPVWALAFSKDAKEMYYIADGRKIDGR